MLNYAIAPLLKQHLIEYMKVHPFSVAVDGSNDNFLLKMNPMAIRIYYVQQNRIVSRFLDMCSCASSTAESLFITFDNKLEELLDLRNPWNLCTSVGVDNTAVNIGCRNSLKTRIVARNSAIYFSGCPCHILHNCARKAADVFTTVFDVKEFVIDVYYYFDKSTKRKNSLLSFCSFCNQEYRSMVKHVSTRWLSLFGAIERTLSKYVSLKSYFLSSDESQAWFVRLNNIFSDPMTEVYLLFLQAVLPTLIEANNFLQRDEPLIHVLLPFLEGLLKTMLGKVVKPAILAES